MQSGCAIANPTRNPASAYALLKVRVTIRLGGCANNDNALVKKNYGKETNRIYRQNFAVTWNGGWDNGITTSNWAQYEHTRNSRL